jgi:lysophospholipase L1-like esterase
VTNIRRRKLKQKEHEVILIGDSHTRECAEKVSNYLGNTYEVTGYINPSTGLEVITNSAKKEIDHMTQKDVVIVCGGVNNINKNESNKGLKYVTHFVQNRRNTTVIIMNAPHRFDLEETSCVNKEIKIFNRKLKQIMKRYNHTEVVDMNTNRDHYTRHGLHMNKTGKERITRNIADAINKLFVNQKLAPITLGWKESLRRGIQPEIQGTGK